MYSFCVVLQERNLGEREEGKKNKRKQKKTKEEENEEAPIKITQAFAHMIGLHHARGGCITRMIETL